MYIGVYDYDLAQKPGGRFIPSLDLMKASYYHKMKGDIVEFCLEGEDVEKYDKCYVRHDVTDRKQEQMVEMLFAPNVEWVGKTQANKFIHLSQEIEDCPPDRTLYRSFLLGNRELFSDSVIRAHNKVVVRDDTMCVRFRANGTYTKDVERALNASQTQFVIYDEPDFLDSEGACDLLDKLAIGGKRFFFVYQQHIRNIETLHRCTWFVRDIAYERTPLLFVDSISHNYAFYKRNASAFGPHMGIYVPLDEELPSFRQFRKLANFFYLRLSQGQYIQIFTCPLTASDPSREDSLIRCFAMFTQNANRTSEHCAMSYGRANFSAKMYAELRRGIQIDQQIFKLFNVPIDQVYNTGVWRKIE